MSGTIRAGRLETLPPGGKRVFRAAGKELLLVRTGKGRLLCLENRCPHAGASLEKGALTEEWIECPRHGARFSLEDGRVLRGPAREPLGRYPVEVDPQGILVVEVGEA